MLPELSLGRCSKSGEFSSQTVAKQGVGVPGWLQNPLCTRKGRCSQSSKSGRVDLWLPGCKCQQLLFNFSRFSQELHFLPSHLDSGGLCPQQKHGQLQAGLEHTFPQIWGCHKGTGLGELLHIPIFPSRHMCSWSHCGAVLQLPSFLINRPDGSSLAYHPLLSRVVYWHLSLPRTCIWAEGEYSVGCYRSL